MPQPDFAQQPVRLVKSNSILPPTLETAIRRFMVDKVTGNIQLNIKDGKILGFHENRMIQLPPTET